jgi:hypothetical protein
MRLISARLPFPICETCRVSMRLLSTSSTMVYKFSPTSPARIHGHHLLNIRQAEGFKDLIQLILHVAAPGLHIAHCAVEEVYRM